MGAICIYAVATVRMPHVWMMVVLFGAGGGFIGSQLGLNGLAASIYPGAICARPASAGRWASVASAASPARSSAARC